MTRKIRVLKNSFITDVSGVPGHEERLPAGVEFDDKQNLIFSKSVYNSVEERLLAINDIIPMPENDNLIHNTFSNILIKMIEVTVKRVARHVGPVHDGTRKIKTRSYLGDPIRHLGEAIKHQLRNKFLLSISGTGQKVSTCL